jgi:fluoride ion exporter CrcB/FEX
MCAPHSAPPFPATLLALWLIWFLDPDLRSDIGSPTPSFLRATVTQVTAALIFSFPGTLTRYLLSTALNPRLKALPLGTLVANISGTALLAAFRVLQSTPSLPSRNRCDILQGLVDGYCGCLTTVSTFRGGN